MITLYLAYTFNPCGAKILSTKKAYGNICFHRTTNIKYYALTLVKETK